MGYTHYFYKLGKHDGDKWAAIFPQLSADTRLLIAASGVDITNSGGEGSPRLTDDIIALNGPEDEGHESFILRRSNLENGSSCKTARKPYDRVVTAILLRATQLLGREYTQESGGEITSDGKWDEWRRGRELVAKVFPDDPVTCPWGERRLGSGLAQ